MKVDTSDKYQHIEAMRISTRSYAQTNNNGDGFKTEWRWYWTDDRGQWKLFEEDTMQYTLETKYLAGQTEFLVTREDDVNVIDFQKMRQTNQRTNKRRDIIRRPLHVTTMDVRHGRTAAKLRPFPVIDVPLPDGWVPWDHTSNFELVRLPSECRAYKDTIDKLFRTVSQADVMVDCVYRVQSHALWDAFCRTERHMTASLERTRPLSVLGRRDLFYGTTSMKDVRRICTHNFDGSASAERETKYHSGVRFSRDAIYSDMFTDGPTCFMFIAHVLVGQFARDDRKYSHPPPLPGSSTGLYDSCVDTLDNPSMFRLFEKNQYYPAYLIQCRANREYISLSGRRMTSWVPHPTGYTGAALRVRGHGGLDLSWWPN